MLAMPPMFRAMCARWDGGRGGNRRNGTSGAPWPPAAMSRRAEIRDNRDAGALGEDGRFADLQRVDAAFMVDGLAVAADQLDGA